MGFVRDEEFRKFFYSDLDHKQLKIHKPHGRNYKSSELINLLIQQIENHIRY